MKYYIIAGEASGDLHGSNLMKGIYKRDPEAQIRFWGGDLMDAVFRGSQKMEHEGFASEKMDAVFRASQKMEHEGCASEAVETPEAATPAVAVPEAAAGASGQVAPAAASQGPGLVRHYREGAVMGLTDVLSKARTLLGNVSFCKSDIAAWRPDVVILIDYPGFNFKIARFAHEGGIKVFYYIAPKTWASRERRNAHLKQWVDRLFIIFPFEIPYFRSRGVPFTYCGNPLVDAIDAHRFDRPVEGRYIALLPGSRKGEISRMMPVCMEVADLLGCQIVIAGAPARSAEDYTRYIGMRANVKLIFGRTYDILKYADAAIINSGTASLEAALIGTPQVVCWSSTAITVWAARHLLRVGDHIRYISLGNLIVDKPVFRELIQEEFNTSAVFAELRRIMEDSSYRSRMLAGYAEIRHALEAPYPPAAGDDNPCTLSASEAIAAAMIEELQKS